MHARLLQALNALFTPREGLKDFSASDYLHRYGRARDALLYALLFIPAFAEVDGSVLQISLRNDKDDLRASFMRRKKDFSSPVWKVERTFNYVETSYIFNAGTTEPLSDEFDFLFAKYLADAWRGRLILLYPTRRFEVSVIGPEESQDGYGITFHEVRDNAPNQPSSS